ncbi:helix-turn-helix domain-containing protein [Mycobacterium intracellulare]|uniref:Helix-turn-helix domain-containing protein n=1 Tax=Mycobacterium intracellulare TaxID=1767 RepID=A0AAE4UEU4_MYCIT|nr:helix-turn-helix domain-containing protein [Mycobacterium intracellulare]MCA2320439.1 helix-turn-helix domain-containing protein [Mycobacterium intracellulare]MCA2340889.1 helix-turn-helix domain-containing protein [Mycobacterium intracellulare]MDV6979052.1 helix-turn-helix domain-containing protein [Mycobacterium intracellulare]MDV6984358.1 helix-turn-helix domain-containing protein [Mycobacterium intracellulare]MDV7014068.1 helix-turn-helix domain-containing protein [Mycobacterium intrace
MGGSTVSALEALLARHSIDITADEVLQELDSAFAAIPKTGAAPLSTMEAQFLRAHAGTGAAAVIAAWADDGERQSRTRAALREFADVISGSLSIKEAAAILGIDRSRVLRGITGKALWAFDLGGNRRIPGWQFLRGELLPGLAVIVPSIPAGASPVIVDMFIHAAQPDFGDRTPIEYLAGGGDALVVAGFIEDLARW